MRKKNNLYVVVILILLVGAFFVFTSFLPGKKAGVRIACKNGEILGFRKPIGPPFCMACVPTCTAKATVSLKNGTVICSNSRTNIGISVFEEETVVVPCDKLPQYKGKELYISAEVNSSLGGFNSNKVMEYE